MVEADELYDAKSKTIISMSAIASVLVIIIALIFIAVLVRLIANPLKQGVAYANTIADGDLTSSLQIDQKDEVGVLADALNNMTAKLKEVISSVMQGTDNIASGSILHKHC